MVLISTVIDLMAILPFCIELFYGVMPVGTEALDGDDAKIDYKFSVDKDVHLSEDEKGRVDRLRGNIPFPCFPVDVLSTQFSHSEEVIIKTHST